MRPSLAIVIATAIVVSACRHEEPPAEQAADIRVARNAGTANAATLGDGDIRITSTDGGVDLALIGDSISGGLSQQSLEKARRETDTNKVKGTGFGADIEKMVKGTVQSALATRVAFPLSAIKDVRYDGRKIVFDWNGTPRISGKMQVNDKDALESFSPEDAQRFVDAVRARKLAR
jgi:hypothetical protein